MSRVPVVPDDAIKLAATIDALWSTKADSMDRKPASKISQISDESHEVLFRNQLRQELQEDLDEKITQFQEYFDKHLAQLFKQPNEIILLEHKVADLEVTLGQRFSDLEVAVSSGLEDIRGTKKSLEELADGLEEGFMEDMTTLKMEVEGLREEANKWMGGPKSVSPNLSAEGLDCKLSSDIGDVWLERLAEFKMEIMQDISQDRKEKHNALAQYAETLDVLSAAQKAAAKNQEIQDARRTNIEFQLNRKVSELEAFVTSHFAGNQGFATYDANEKRLTHGDVAALQQEGELHRAARNADEPRRVAEHSDTVSTQFTSDASDDTASSEGERIQKFVKEQPPCANESDRLATRFSSSVNVPIFIASPSQRNRHSPGRERSDNGSRTMISRPVSTNSKQSDVPIFIASPSQRNRHSPGRERSDNGSRTMISRPVSTNSKQSARHASSPRVPPRVPAANWECERSSAPPPRVPDVLKRTGNGSFQVPLQFPPQYLQNKVANVIQTRRSLPIGAVITSANTPSQST